MRPLGERNDVVLAGLNHKMGYRGTTQLPAQLRRGQVTGRKGRTGAIGYLVGEPGRGLAAMFHMMNEARIGVGLGATMLGYGGYLHSLDYARNRPQGRPIGPAGKDPTQPQIPIIAACGRQAHAARAEGVRGRRAGTESVLRAPDRRRAQRPRMRPSARNATLLLDILTPVAKSWPSQWCVEGNSLAIQVHGGYGYTRDYPVEQFYRDNRLNAIHEGTHGIQALDLLGRKVVMQDGAALTLLGAWIEADDPPTRRRRRTRTRGAGPPC